MTRNSSNGREDRRQHACCAFVNQFAASRKPDCSVTEVGSPIWEMARRSVTDFQMLHGLLPFRERSTRFRDITARRMRMRRTGPEPADAYGHPTGGTYTLGVGCSRSHPPRPKHPRPSRRPECPGGARAAGPRFGDHLQVLTDKFKPTRVGCSCGSAGTPDWLEGPAAQPERRTSPREGRGGRSCGTAGTPDWLEGSEG